jgi:hypothetical protein
MNPEVRGAHAGAGRFWTVAGGVVRLGLAGTEAGGVMRLRRVE